MAIKVSPLNLAEKNFPVAQRNLEIQVNNKWSISPEMGIKIPSLVHQPDTSIYKNYSGYRIRLEVRKYLLPVKNINKSYCRAYITGSVFFSSNKYNSSFFNYDSTYNKNENFGVDQIFYGIESRFGLQIVHFNRLLIDCFLGIRIKHKTIKKSGLIKPSYPYPEPGPNDASLIFSTINSFFDDNNTDESSGVVLMLSLGIKVGYTITKNRFR